MGYGKLVKRQDIEELENNILASYAVKVVRARAVSIKKKSTLIERDFRGIEIG